MKTFSLPYGQGQHTCHLPDGLPVEVVEPLEVAAAADPLGVVEAALGAPLGGVRLSDSSDARSAAVVINDKTRPLPYGYLLPPLLRCLEGLGLLPESIALLIATGAHPPMLVAEFARVAPAEVLARYPICCHDADDAPLVHLGTTSRGTPVWVNRRFLEIDLRLVVGNVEPHQFQGFSCGVKSAAIGLARHETVNRNHALMIDPRTRLGRHADDPARQDVEKIGKLIGVQFALNALLNGQKQVVHAVAGEPQAVMAAAIPLSQEISQAPVAVPFDLMIASAGEHPKDLNLYQAQKALAHAALVTRNGGVVIVVAACPEGTGSREYEAWMAGMGSYEDVFARFERERFRVGPHKAAQIARDAARVRTFLVSEMAPALVQRLLLTPASSVDAALRLAMPDLRQDILVGIIPRAALTIPYLVRGAEIPSE
jgi:nickel-dependent lactate racemase